jgi:hypothetical protein
MHFACTTGVEFRVVVDDVDVIVRGDAKGSGQGEVFQKMGDTVKNFLLISN